MWKNSFQFFFVKFEFLWTLVREICVVQYDGEQRERFQQPAVGFLLIFSQTEEEIVPQGYFTLKEVQAKSISVGNVRLLSALFIFTPIFYLYWSFLPNIHLLAVHSAEYFLYAPVSVKRTLTITYKAKYTRAHTTHIRTQINIFGWLRMLPKAQSSPQGLFETEQGLLFERGLVLFGKDCSR